MFGFGAATLSDVGKSRLDNMMKGLREGGFKATSVTVTGHTDPLGKPDFNQKLSLQRANTVRDYMVSKGVPAGIIQTEGKGETEPKVTEADCKAKGQAKNHNALVQCLLPDRRVEIKATGEQTTP